MRRPRRHHFRRAVRLALLGIGCLLLFTGVAFGWILLTSNPGNSISALTVGTAGEFSATPHPSTGTCTSVQLAWTAAPHADRYRIEKNTTGTWSTIAASHATTSIVDETSYTNVSIEYRVTPLLGGTSWEGAASTTSATCGMANIGDLKATHGCSDVSLSWGAIAEASRYEVWRSVNGGAFAALTTNAATTTYDDTSAYAAGDDLAYKVIPRVGGTAGTESNIAVVTDWDRFRVTSVVLNNGGGVPLGLAPGDQAIVKFSKPVRTGTATQTRVVVSSGKGRGIYFAAGSAAASSTDIGSVGTPNGLINVGGTFDGIVSWNAARTSWTWTATSAQANVMDGALTGTWALGMSPTRALCHADGTPLAATAPPLTGSW